MEITVSFTSQLKAALGKSEQVVSVDQGATVRDVVNALATQYPTEFAQLVLVNGELLPSILLSLNDSQVDVDAPLSAGDTLTLLSAISGG